ncbi:MAG: ABC transporter permease [Alphaproteobacteria bacterium]|nr:ABC transporter permease [Alphaproteobacteria bacterium]
MARNPAASTPRTPGFALAARPAATPNEPERIGVPAARAVVTVLGMLAAWQALVVLFAPPPFILPDPLRVFRSLVERRDLLLAHGLVTIAEILAGLVLGAVAGCAFGILVAAWAPARRWLEPLLVGSQALPVFALAPILVLWFGYGFASKVAMATLVIFFPVAIAAQDGIARTDPVMVLAARSLGLSDLQILRFIRLPLALPTIATSLRIAAAIAPIGAIIGEWVGAAAGLGFVMLQANARMQTDLMFAAVMVLCVIAVALHRAVGAALDLCLPWIAPPQPGESP